MWTDRLADNGLLAVAVDKRHARISRDGAATTYRLVHYGRRVHPRDIEAPPETHSLLIAPVLSTTAASAARQLGWSVVSDEGPSWLILDRTTVELASVPDETTEPGPVQRRGRPGYGLYTVFRSLLAPPPFHKQAQLAAAVRISQPRVSQILQQLEQAGVVTRTADGWGVTDPRTAIDWWTENYPGPGGLKTYWFGLDPVVRQARTVYDFLASVGGNPAVSGDVAADMVAPWRVPRRALVYAERGSDLSEIGLTPTDQASATLVLVLPDDNAVWPQVAPDAAEASAQVDTMARASSLQVLYDLKRGDGPDADDAVRTWRQWMLKGNMWP